MPGPDGPDLGDLLRRSQERMAELAAVREQTAGLQGRAGAAGRAEEVPHRHAGRLRAGRAPVPADDGRAAPKARPPGHRQMTARSGSPTGGAGSRARLDIAVLGAAALVGLVVLARPLWWYATGTPTKAAVERCDDPGRRPLVCSGTWTLPDGTGHHGRIAGAGEGDEGKTVPVRASASHAATFSPRLVYGPALVLLVAAIFGYWSMRPSSWAKATFHQARCR